MVLATVPRSPAWVLTNSASITAPWPGTTFEVSDSIPITRSIVSGHSSGKESSPYDGGADSSTRSPTKNTSTSGTTTTVSPEVCALPRCSSSTRRSPRSITFATENVVPSRFSSAAAFSCRYTVASVKTLLPTTWSKCAWVLTTHRTGASVSSRMCARNSEACSVVARVSITSAPSLPTTRPTLSSHSSYRWTQQRSPTSVHVMPSTLFA